MRIRFYANMRTTVGRSSLEINDGNIDSFRKLMVVMVNNYPEITSHLLDKRGGLRPDVPVFVDGRNPRLMQDGLNTPLHADSVISFFSPISSGKMNVEVLRAERELTN